VSARADAQREMRWRDEGGARLTVRVSGEVDREIDRLAAIHRCTRRAVIEGLVLGTLQRSPVPEEVSAAMRMHGLTLSEATAFCERRS
jgi:hypothetical protein